MRRFWNPFQLTNARYGTFAGGREFFIDNLLVRIHFIIVMIRWTGLAPWEFEFPFPPSQETWICENGLLRREGESFVDPDEKLVPTETLIPEPSTANRTSLTLTKSWYPTKPSTLDEKLVPTDTLN